MRKEGRHVVVGPVEGRGVAPSALWLPEDVALTS